ncbi:hypothetical protein GQR58_011108 [Nymphon striatum]|nr:hypothetical protein GQR58_011108 [Nymphon striatum]
MLETNPEHLEKMRRRLFGTCSPKNKEPSNKLAEIRTTESRGAQNCNSSLKSINSDVFSIDSLMTNPSNFKRPNVKNRTSQLAHKSIATYSSIDSLSDSESFLNSFLPDSLEDLEFGANVRPRNVDTIQDNFSDEGELSGSLDSITYVFLGPETMIRSKEESNLKRQYDLPVISSSAPQINLNQQNNTQKELKTTIIDKIDSGTVDTVCETPDLKLELKSFVKDAKTLLKKFETSYDSSSSGSTINVEKSNYNGISKLERPTGNSRLVESKSKNVGTSTTDITDEHIIRPIGGYTTLRRKEPKAVPERVKTGQKLAADNSTQTFSSLKSNYTWQSSSQLDIPQLETDSEFELYQALRNVSWETTALKKQLDAESGHSGYQDLNDKGPTKAKIPFIGDNNDQESLEENYASRKLCGYSNRMNKNGVISAPFGAAPQPIIDENNRTYVQKHRSYQIKKIRHILEKMVKSNRSVRDEIKMAWKILDKNPVVRDVEELKANKNMDHRMTPCEPVKYQYRNHCKTDMDNKSRLSPRRNTTHTREADKKVYHNDVNRKLSDVNSFTNKIVDHPNFGSVNISPNSTKTPITKSVRFINSPPRDHSHFENILQNSNDKMTENRPSSKENELSCGSKPNYSREAVIQTPSKSANYQQISEHMSKKFDRNNRKTDMDSFVHRKKDSEQKSGTDNSFNIDNQINMHHTTTHYHDEARRMPNATSSKYKHHSKLFDNLSVSSSYKSLPVYISRETSSYLFPDLSLVSKKTKIFP